MSQRIKCQRGFHLVELIIAVAVGTIGLLGIAALLLITIKHTQNSVYRTSAVVIVGQLADKIRANKVATKAYVTTNDNFSGIVSGNFELIESTNISQTNCYGKAISCTPDEVAGYDMFLWWLQVKTLLPNPIASVAIDEDDKNRLLLEVSWQEQTNKESSDNQSGYYRSIHRVEIRP